MCPDGDVDRTWGIEWDAIRTGARASQPCPVVMNTETTGFAFRECGDDGEWEEEVDVTSCKTSAIADIEDQAVSSNMAES